jgi:hypothetical protein
MDLRRRYGNFVIPPVFREAGAAVVIFGLWKRSVKKDLFDISSTIICTHSHPSPV